MKLRILGHPSYEGTYDFDKTMSLKEIYETLGGKKRPKLIQVGGALGPLYKDYEIQLTLDVLDHAFYEPTISFFDQQLCSVDFMRFMLRFIMRELNIVSEHLKSIYEIIEKLSNGKTEAFDREKFEALLQMKSASDGEVFLKRNMTYLLEHFNEEIKEHFEGYCQNSICRGLFDAQCINACPAHIHIPGYVALMKDNRISEAYQLMRQENPLSSVCGSVCARPCEARCRRGEITSTVGVRALQRFISSEALKSWAFEENCLPENGKKIAIIGGGPSGLTAAYYLRKTGYTVTIYEKESQAGGMLSFGVPSYRLPIKSIQDEVKTIERLGVKIEVNTSVNQEMFKQLQLDHDVVLMATGATVGRQLPLEFDQKLTGIEFLKSVRLNKNVSIGKNVLVIGGGDVAFDCARTAKRLGSEVTLMSLESYEALPASFEEIYHGKQENIQLKNGYAIHKIEAQKIYLSKCTQVTDDAGRFKPAFEESNEILLNIDTIIMSVGQVADLSYVTDEHSINRGFIKTLDYKVTTGVYASGDVIKPSIVIDAIAQGKKVASQIDLDLGGHGLFVGEPIEIPEKLLNIRTFDFDMREEETSDPLSRVKNFTEVSTVYSLDDALYEAERCMRCDRNSKASLLLGR